MNDLEVEIVQLKPMRVAASLGFGPNPEELAFSQMYEFASTKGLLEEGVLPITYGFNNPDPSPGSPNYGYEVWLPIPDDINSEGEISIVDFQGGDYVVTRFQGLEKIGEVWKQLVMWQENSEYERGSHQWLEKLLNSSETNIEKMMFELYLPISIG